MCKAGGADKSRKQGKGNGGGTGRETVEGWVGRPEEEKPHGKTGRGGKSAETAPEPRPGRFGGRDYGQSGRK
ncbi:hypothetical protein KML24008_21490 [Alistipes onderdonkii]